MTFDGRIALTGRPLALAGAYVGLLLSAGSAEVDVRGRTAWPLPSPDAFKSFEGSGAYRIELAGAAPKAENVTARVNGDFTVSNGAVKAHLEPGGLIQADVQELRRVAGKADLGARVCD
jgi:hypothetical protein